MTVKTKSRVAKLDLPLFLPQDYALALSGKPGYAACCDQSATLAKFKLDPTLLSTSLIVLRAYGRDELYVDLNNDASAGERFVPFDPELHHDKNYALYPPEIVEKFASFEKISSQNGDIFDPADVLNELRLGRVEDLKAETILQRARQAGEVPPHTRKTTIGAHTMFAQGLAKQIEQGFAYAK